MEAYLENLDKMFAVWNSTDEGLQEKNTDSALEHNIHFVDPNHNIIGRKKFLEMVRKTQEQIPGAVYARSSSVGFQNNFCRYHWSIKLGDKTIMTGFDMAEINDAGKVVKIVGFFGELEKQT